jgi:4-amino-4-deoxy-L-arabinose transferase-like glycosyltransferase
MNSLRSTISRRWLLPAILALSVAARVAAALYLGNSVELLPGTYDQVSYHNLALRLLDGYGFTFADPWWPLTRAGAPTAHWSYLYTGFLTAVYGLLGAYPIIARLIQAVLVGILQPYLTYKLGRLAFDEATGLLAAALTAAYSYFIYYAATLMTEPFYITAILGALYLSMRLARTKADRSWKTGLLLGLLLGIAVLLRQLFLLLVPLFFLWIWLVTYLRERRVPLQATVSACLVIVAMIVPFTLYNYSRFDRFVLLNTNAGFAFFWANHPIYGTHFQPILPPEMGTYQDLIPHELRRLDEAALDRALLQRGVQFVLQDPIRYALLSLSRIPPYFLFWPTSDSSTISNLARVSSFGLLWPFMLLGLALTFWRQKIRAVVVHPTFLLLLFALGYSAIHILSWTLIRYRLPVDAAMVLFAASAILSVVHWLSQRGWIGEQIRTARP